MKNLLNLEINFNFKYEENDDTLIKEIKFNFIYRINEDNMSPIKNLKTFDTYSRLIE